ncbi:MAG: c-type cytochrome [Planctomycetes bacterium]|nr:c-type cytochrome [Planctomycetota bacterium]
MPVSVDKLYIPEKINVWFAVSSVLMMLSLAWLIWVDYDRPWHAYQDDYAIGKAGLAHLDYLNAITRERMDEIERAERAVRDAREFAAQTSSRRRAELRADLAESDLRFRQTEGPYSRGVQVLQVVKDTYERALNSYGGDDERTIAAHEALVAKENEVDADRTAHEEWADRKKEIEGEIKGLDQQVRDAERVLADLEKVAADALAKDMQYRGVLTDTGILGGLPIVTGVINAPMLDFTAPKNTPGRYQVNQLVLPDVRTNLNYLVTYTTDRCMTCHVSIDDPSFSMENLARQFERSLPAIDEELQRLGEPPIEWPPVPVLEGRGDAKLAKGRVTDHWKELTHAQQSEYFDALLATVNGYFAATGRKAINLRQPLLAHPDLELFVSIDSAHPKAKMGCTVCHEGNSEETDFVFAAHSPPTHAIEKEWAEKYYDRMAGVPTATFDLIAHYWDRPMHPPAYTQAGCAKCHAEVSDIKSYAGKPQGEKLNLGRYLFTTVGCANCHDVDQFRDARRVGPDLKHIASKLSPEFVHQWIFAPQRFRPSTRMPHFFLQENNRTESANSLDHDPITRTETEVAAISKYLFSVSADFAPVQVPEGIEGDAERGRALFKELGCLACHANLAEFGQEWIVEDLQHSWGKSPEDAYHQFQANAYGKKPNYDMPAHERMTMYAMEHFTSFLDATFDPEPGRFDPDKEYNPPVFTRFAPELSGVGSKVTIEWLYDWLMDPTRYSPDTRMPSFRLSPREAADIATYLMTLRYDAFDQHEFPMDAKHIAMLDEQLFAILSSQRSQNRSRAIIADEGGELTEMIVALVAKSDLAEEGARRLVSSMDHLDRKLMFFGSKMITHYGCYACHNIAGFKDSTPPGTDLSKWATKPIGQLDFAFYDHAFYEMRERREDVFGHVYPLDADELNHRSPTDNPKEQVTHRHAAFAKHKMLNPRIWDREKIKGPYDKLKMPNYYFTDREAEALTTFLLSRRAPLVNDTLKVKYDGTTDGAIARGRNLTRELNCVACHEIEDNNPTIQQYFRREFNGRPSFDVTNAPPSLWGEGAKIQHPWLHRFLGQVETLRPWLGVRMPSFKLSGDEATTIVEYFAALSKQDADDLRERMGRIDEYRKSVHDKKRVSAGNGNATEEAENWFKQERLMDEAADLRRWVIGRKLMRSRKFDTLGSSDDALRAAHGDLLDRVNFMKDLYAFEYPFVEPPRPLSPKDRFELGARFFNDIGCLSCHVLGEMLPGPAHNTDEFVQIYRLDAVRGEGDEAIAVLNGVGYPVGSVIDGHTLISAKNIDYDGDVVTIATVEGPSANGETEQIALSPASAPNLSLTQRRLRRAWVYAWMLQPGWMQPGTKMPMNFPDGKSPFEGHEDYPATSADQIDLLVDFLYDAGARGTRADLVKSVVQPEAEFDEDDFDD